VETRHQAQTSRPVHFEVGAGHAVFDGQGVFTAYCEASSERECLNVLPVPGQPHRDVFRDQFTLPSRVTAYGLNRLGRLCIEHPPCFGMVSRSGHIIIYPEFGPNHPYPVITFFVESIDNDPGATLTDDDLTGRYNFIEVSHEVPVHDPRHFYMGAGFGILDGAGNLATHEEYNSDEGPRPGDPDFMRYTVLPHGRLTITDLGTVPGPALGMVSPDGDLIIQPVVDPTLSGEIGVTFLVKANDSLTIADLEGRYNFIGGHSCMIAGYADFDGTGNALLQREISSAAVGPFPTQFFSYDVHEQGRMSVDGGSPFGIVSPDGDLIIVPVLGSTELDEFGLTLFLRAR
jgi:hypothetical protein